jgi:hypothetical protein
VEPEFPVEFVVFGTPVSMQGTPASVRAWKQRIKDASYDSLPEMHAWYEGAVAVTIYHFPPTEMAADVDNIVKPILDALSGHILKDDRQVVRVTVQKFEPGLPALFGSPSAGLTTALTAERPVTYIAISNEPFGEIA